MQVFKFGGASVKDAEGVINLAKILTSYPEEELIVVVSAMGKTTNLLEQLVKSYMDSDPGVQDLLSQAKKNHFEIAAKLFEHSEHPVFDEINNLFVEIEWILEEEPADPYDYIYDQIVSVGELLSTTIISHYLNQVGLKNTWLDARNFIATDNHFREGNVDWEKTEKLIQSSIPKLLQTGMVVTQGFIGSTSENFSTTLGREGSDYSAAIFASCLDADQVCIWKDVPGILNADPKWFGQTELIPELSYQDAIELTYYGATVIHPKTIKPLQNKGIPLRVKSFQSVDAAGTVIGKTTESLPIPSFIFKINQVLISIMPKDFSFIVEDNLSQIFHLFHKNRLKINMLHNSAISFSVSVDHDQSRIASLLADLKMAYDVEIKPDLELITIRYYDQQTIDRVLVNKDVIMELKDKYTCQLLVKTGIKTTNTDY